MRVPHHHTGLRLSLAAALILAATAGCGGDKKTNPVITPPGGTPASTLARLDQLYEDQSLAEYGKLFTADFSFRFSAEADPILAAHYGTSWNIDDEIISAGHLFDGFVSTDPPYEDFGGATSITMSLIGPQVLPDSTHTDSTAHYQRVVVPTVDLSIRVVNSSFETIYEVRAGHEFFLVRGDAAVLADGQAADSLHWYIRRWDDHSPAPFARTGQNGVRRGEFGLQSASNAAPATWGMIKSAYRR